jgi:hypothetical protein
MILSDRISISGTQYFVPLKTEGGLLVVQTGESHVLLTRTEMFWTKQKCTLLQH